MRRNERIAHVDAQAIHGGCPFST